MYKILRYHSIRITKQQSIFLYEPTEQWSVCSNNNWIFLAYIRYSYKCYYICTRWEEMCCLYVVCQYRLNTFSHLKLHIFIYIFILFF